ncbi:orotate phosphoribosyltransferase [Halobacteriales archaeon QS_4_69_31]|nr:MAG: orotate phosphoribosyltransferase [Halobacteriales archaeon QS_4_69_31]
MNYRGVNALKGDTRHLCHSLPQRIDLVVGIPRSGLLPANLLCLYLDVPMTDVTGLCRGELFETGRRYTESVSFEEFDTVLVLDDSVYSGTQMTETRERLADEEFPFDIEYGAIYVTRDSRKYVDHWSEVVPAPRVFEWNVMHHDILRNACVDIDGVLCRDPTPAENDDGENYREFLTQVEPSVVPNRRIGWLVTCRLEKYREETEAWLNEHGIDYRRLVMMDYPDMETRQAAGDHAAFKARVYDEAETKLFIESTREQAREICERTGKPVFCYESAELFEPDQTTKIRQNSRSYLSQFYENPVGFSQVAIKYLVRQLST